MGGLVRRRGERHITRSADNRHPGVRNRAEGELTGGRAACSRCSARGGDEDIDLLPDERGKLARREFVDRLQHPGINVDRGQNRQACLSGFIGGRTCAWPTTAHNTSGGVASKN